MKICGWLLLGVVIAVLACVVLVHLPGTWDPDQKAWSRLPAGTRWAAQIHDLGGLLTAAMRDPATEALLVDAIDAVREEFPGAKLGTGDGARSAADFLGMLRKMEPVLSVIAPNAFLFGGSGFSVDESFLIFQPPVWMRWMGIFQGWDGVDVREERDDEDPGARPVYFALHGDWMISAARRETVLRIREEWDAEHAPLGADAGMTDAHLYLAVADADMTAVPASPSAPVPAGQGTPSHFTFANPFAEQAQTGASPVAVADRLAGFGAARLLVTPSETGWNVWGEAAEQGGFGTGLLDDSLLGESTPVETPPAPFAVTASARVSPSANAELLSLIPEQSSDGKSPARTFLHFLRSSWLANTGNAWSLLAGEPIRAANAEAPPYPPLPLFRLGWSLPAGRDPASANEAFTDGLAQTIESLGSPDDSVLMQTLLSTLSLSRTDAGGVLNIPPVLVNGARMAWRFGSNPDWGWLATTPDGFPEFPQGATESTVPEPEEGHARLGAEWDFRGNGFLAAAAAVIEDRLRNHSADRESFGERAYRVARRLAEHFPVGNFSGDIDMKNRRLEFKAAVSKGAEEE